MPEPSDYVITIEGGGWSARVTLTEEEFERLAGRMREMGRSLEPLEQEEGPDAQAEASGGPEQIGNRTTRRGGPCQPVR